MRLPYLPAFIILVIFSIYTSCNKEKEDTYFPYANMMDTVIHDGIIRTYLLHIPPGYSESEQTPLVIALHGYTSSATSFENGSRLSDKADAEGFIIAYPNGLAYPWTSSNPQAWNAGSQYEEWTRGTDDVGFIDDMLELIKRHYSIDASRIFVTGHSNGSRMTYRVGYELSCKIAAIAPHSGQMVFEPETHIDCPVPVLHLHATDDHTVLYNGSTAANTSDLVYAPVDSVLSDWAAMFSCNADPETIFSNVDYTIKKWNCPGDYPDIELYLTNRGDHGWFTIENSGLSANDVIWNFFKAHPK
jgi:polyhydroxybutyrate depolymerase